MTISDKLRQEVVSRAHGLCEYCQTSQDIVVYMEVDHIIPVSLGGETISDNLCLSCALCNRSKHNDILGIDPQTGEKYPLFNPRTEKWKEHFKWSEDSTEIIGLTPTGKATIAQLNMNRDSIIKARSAWVTAGWHPPNT